jgi:hypothetical protein
VLLAEIRSLRRPVEEQGPDLSSLSPERVKIAREELKRGEFITLEQLPSALAQDQPGAAEGSTKPVVQSRPGAIRGAPVPAGDPLSAACLWTEGEQGWRIEVRAEADVFERFALSVLAEGDTTSAKHVRAMAEKRFGETVATLEQIAKHPCGAAGKFPNPPNWHCGECAWCLAKEELARLKSGGGK